MQNNTEPRRANRLRDSCTISVRGAHSKTDERKKSKRISSFKTRLWKITNVITTQKLGTIYELHRPSSTKLKVAQCNDVDPALPKIVSLYQCRKLNKTQYMNSHFGIYQCKGAKNMDERDEGSRIGKRTSWRQLHSCDCSVTWRLTLDLVPNSALTLACGRSQM